MDIKKLIEEIHADAIEKGWYECPECMMGSGCCNNDDHECNGICSTSDCPSKCKSCNGTGTDPNRNIGEMLMLIVSELGEALEAHRCGKFCKIDNLSFDMNYQEDSPVKSEIGRFEVWVKDTFEDEIADVFIRLFDLCGYLEIDFIMPENETGTFDNIGENLFSLTRLITEIYPLEKDLCKIKDILSLFVRRLYRDCQVWNIPIEKHITAKMAYNKTRPHKHGKKY